MAPMHEHELERSRIPRVAQEWGIDLCLHVCVCVCACIREREKASPEQLDFLWPCAFQYNNQPQKTLPIFSLYYTFGNGMISLPASWLSL